MDMKAKAREVFEDLMNVINAVPGEIHIKRGKKLFSRGEKAYSYGDYEKAILLFKDAKEQIDKKVIENENIRQLLEETARMIEDIKKKRGNYRKAERNLKKARDALSDNDIKRTHYFEKRARENAEEKLSSFGDGPKKEEIKDVAEKEVEGQDHIWEWEAEVEEEGKVEDVEVEKNEDVQGEGTIQEETLESEFEEEEEHPPELEKKVVEEAVDEGRGGEVKVEKYPKIPPPEIYLPDEKNDPPLPTDDEEEKTVPPTIIGITPGDETDISSGEEEQDEAPSASEWDETEVPPLPLDGRLEMEEETVEKISEKELQDKEEGDKDPEISWGEEIVEEPGEENIDGGTPDEKKRLEQIIKNIRERIEIMPFSIDFNELNNWLERAEESIRLQDLNNARRRINKSKKMLTEKENEVNALKDLFKKADDLLGKARELDLNTGQIEAAFDNTILLLEEGYVTKPEKHCKEIIIHLNEMIDGHECRDIMLELKKRILELKGQGIDIIRAAEVFNSAGELMKQKNYIEVRALVNESQRLARESELEFLAGEIISNVESSISKLKEHNIDLESIENNITRARLLLEKEMNFEEAYDLASATKNILAEEIDPLIEKNTTLLNNLVEENQNNIYVKEELEEMGIAKELVEKGEVVEAFCHISSALKAIEMTRENSYPLIDFKFTNDKLVENVWNRARVIIKNTGKAHAKNINIKLIGPVEIRRLTNIPELDAKESMEMEVAIKFDGGGSVPVDIELSYKSKLDGEVYESRDGLWIEVGTGNIQNEGGRGASSFPDTNGTIFKPKMATRCKICLGVIKPSSKLYECGCGRNYHATCIEQVGECPSCGLEVQE